MNNLRKLLLILVVVMLSGCSVKYELVINSDSSVNEKVIAKESSIKLKKNTGMKSAQAAQYLYELHNRDGLDSKITTIEDNNYTKSTITAYHDSIDNYISSFYSDIFTASNIQREGDKVTLSFEQIRKINPDDINRLLYDEIEVSIKIPFKVLEHNADERNGEKYIWKIKKNQDLREIKIVYDEKNLKNKVKVKVLDTTFDIRYDFLAIGIIFLIIIIITVIVLINNKKNNKV